MWGVTGPLGTCTFLMGLSWVVAPSQWAPFSWASPLGTLLPSQCLVTARAGPVWYGHIPYQIKSVPYGPAAAPALIPRTHEYSQAVHSLLPSAFRILFFLPFSYPVRTMLHNPHLKYFENKFHPNWLKSNLFSLNNEHFSIFSFSLRAADKAPVNPHATRPQH